MVASYELPLKTYGYYESPLFEGISIALCFPFGTVHESSSEAGFAHLFEHVLAKRIQRELEFRTAKLQDAEFQYSAHSYPFHTEFQVEIHANTQDSYLILLDATCSALFDKKPIERNEIEPEIRIIDREVSLRIGSNPLSIVPWAFARSILSINSDKRGHNSFITTNRMSTDAGLDDLNRWKTNFTQNNCSIGFTAHPKYKSLVANFVAQQNLTKIKKLHFLHQMQSPLSEFQDATLSQTLVEKSSNSIGLETKIFPTYTHESPSWQRAMFLLATQVIRHMASKRMISSGFFGSFHGPDYQIILELFQNYPVSQQLLLQNLTNEILELAQSKQLRESHQILKNQGIATSLMARDALFNLDHSETINALKYIKLSEVRRHICGLQNTPGVFHYFSDKGAMI